MPSCMTIIRNIALAYKPATTDTFDKTVVLYYNTKSGNDCIIWNSILLIAELHPYSFFKLRLDVYNSYMYEPFE